MDQAGAREAFAGIAAREDAAIDLAEAALWIAAEEHDGVDVAGSLERLDELAREAAQFLATASSDTERVVRLNEFLFEQKRFCGNQADYYNPKNSFLDTVLERRRGIPITLSVVYLEVARRLGLAAHGIGFPGHFLVSAGEPPLLVDPFHGRLVTRADCEDLLEAALGPSAELLPDHLQTIGSREILARLLQNLKRIHLKAEAYEAALACSERILLLLPEQVTELRDRGLIFAKLECFGPALDDLETFLERSRDPRLRGGIENMLDHLREQVQKIH